MSQVLNIPTLSLNGLHMIEASAGTGKTWTIAALYLRLLLERALPVEKILVVTYTNAATAELRARIRLRLLEAQQACLTGKTDDDVLQDIFKRVAPDRAQVLLTLALESFDLAAIHTIHGFCQRALAERAFESGLPFESELASDDRRVLHEAAEDFWRTTVSGDANAAPDTLWLSWLLGRVPGPAELLKQLSAHFGKPYLLQIPAPVMDEAAAARFSATFERVQRLWQREGRVAIDLLLTHPGMNGTTHKPARITKLAAALDAWLAGPVSLAAPKDVERLGSNGIKVKSGHAKPAHTVFDAIDELLLATESIASVFEARLGHLLQQALQVCESNVRTARQRLATRSFDDLLLDLHAALMGEGGAALVQALRQRYAAALIDEFQDTDPLQYEIFAKVFVENASAGAVGAELVNSPLPIAAVGQATFNFDHEEIDRPAPLAQAGLLFCSLVGDPKQAIYSFRGADLRAYLEAKALAGEPLVLNINRRSSAALIAAVNSVFSKYPRPFLDEELGFEPVQAPSSAPAPILLDGKPLPAMAMWLMPRQGKEQETNKTGKLGLISKTRANPSIAEAVAASIAELLAATAAGRVTLEDKGTLRPLAGQDIAVLVKSHYQGQLVRDALQTLGVASVRYGQDSIFHSHDALEVERVLLAMAHPAREGLVRSALATRLMGVRGDELAALAPTGVSAGHGNAWLQRLEDFHRWHVLARDRGFIRMWRTWQLEADVAPRLLALPDGERHMTNLLHLSDLLATLAHDDKLGIEALAKHLADARNDERSESNSGDGRLLRLESDENLVRIVTIHTSKGLEYPVTYCPYLWDGGLRDNPGPVRYHDPEHGHRAALDFGSNELEAHKEIAAHESRAEALRLAYVALTRARQHCVLVWGAMSDASTSPLAWLLHGNEAPDLAMLNDAALRAHLQQWQAECAHIQVMDMPQPYAAPLQTKTDTLPTLAARPYPTRATLPWRMHSFSAWLQNADDHVSASDELPDHDAHAVVLPVDDVAEAGAASQPDAGASDSSSKSAPEAQAGLSVSTLRTFPHGANAGTCLHDMFERADFAAPEANVIATSLEEFGFDADLQATALQLISNSLCTPLSAAVPPLSEIPRGRQIREMEFMLPMQAPDMHALAAAVGEGAGADGRLAERLRSLQPAHLKGFLKGFIDLVFEHEGCFYVLDYKSNFLGERIGSYAPDKLALAMSEAMYDLQALLYCVALHLALQQRVPGYAYEQHCGGSLYLFLRGMQPEVPGSGVFAWRPSQAMVERVAACLATKVRVLPC